MPYSLEVIQKALASEYGVRVSKPKLKLALERPQFIPDAGRMVVVSNRPDARTRYGIFKGMVSSEYELEDGSKWNTARVLTSAEIAKVF